MRPNVLGDAFRLVERHLVDRSPVSAAGVERSGDVEVDVAD